MKGYLLIEASGTRLGIRVEDVLRVVELGPVHPAPSGNPAVRGVTEVEGRMMPLVHLGAVLVQGRPELAARATAVVVRCAGAAMAVAVDVAETVVRQAPEPLPGGWRVSWADGVGRWGGGLVPILDVGALAERLTSTEPGGP